MEEIFDFVVSKKEEYIEILYNNCYGGFGFSKEAIQLYNVKLLEKNPEAKEIKYDFEVRRSDPILLEVYYEMNGSQSKRGEGFNDRHSEVRSERIPKKYENYYHINEYDGTETVEINYNGYEIGELRRIANDESLSYEDRIK